MMYLIDSYGPQYGASAVSANVFSRCIFAVAFPLFAIQSELLPGTLRSNIINRYIVYHRLGIR